MIDRLVAVLIFTICGAYVDDRDRPRLGKVSLSNILFLDHLRRPSQSYLDLCMTQFYKAVSETGEIVV